MARVAQELQFVAMKAVAIIGDEMEDGDGGCDGEQDCCISAAVADDPNSPGFQRKTMKPPDVAEPRSDERQPQIPIRPRSLRDLRSGRTFDSLASPLRRVRSLRVTAPLRCEHQEQDSRVCLCLSTKPRRSRLRRVFRGAGEHGRRPCQRRLRPGCPCRCLQRRGIPWA